MLLKISDIPDIVWTDEISFWLNKASPLWMGQIEDEGILEILLRWRK